MKTSMQELIQKLKAKGGGMEIYLNANTEIINEALAKEKEQIMNAYCDGAKGGANGTKGQHEFGWVSRHTRNKYYNQTYNQNK
jgi:hypothetical protein